MWWYVFWIIIGSSVIVKIIISLKSNKVKKPATVATTEIKEGAEKVEDEKEETKKDVPLKIKHRYGPKPWSAVWGTIILLLIVGIVYNYSRGALEWGKSKISSPVQKETVVVLQEGKNFIVLDTVPHTYLIPGKNRSFYFDNSATVDYLVNGLAGNKGQDLKMGNSRYNQKLVIMSREKGKTGEMTIRVENKIYKPYK